MMLYRVFCIYTAVSRDKFCGYETDALNSKCTVS